MLIADHLKEGGSRLIYEVESLKQVEEELRKRGLQRFGIPDGPCLNFSGPSGNRDAIFEATRSDILEGEFQHLQMGSGNRFGRFFLTITIAFLSRRGTERGDEIVNFGYKKNIIMDIAVKKVELIEWLARLQDEKLIERIETLRKGSIKEMYEQRMPKTSKHLLAKLDQSEKDVAEGKVHSQEDVENYFKARFKR